MEEVHSFDRQRLADMKASMLGHVAVHWQPEHHLETFNEFNSLNVSSTYLICPRVLLSEGNCSQAQAD